MPFGKTIRIFLMDGDPGGRMACELSNWSGKAYKIPRTMIKTLKDRKELDGKACVYILFGKTEDDGDLAYIGEADGVVKRLEQHLGGKEFWNEAIIFFSKDEQLNKAHVKYIENRLFTIATETTRYALDNRNEPPLSNISEADRAEMEEFIENIKLLVSTLGHRLFEEKRKVVVPLPETGGPVPPSDEAVFHINTKGLSASGKATAEGFVVFAGSQSPLETVPSTPLTVNRWRKELIERKILTKQTDCFEFSIDHVFSSPSLAASVVMGRSANGQTEWRLSDGTSLKKFEDGDEAEDAPEEEA